MAMIELVDFNENADVKPEKKAKTTRRSRGKKAEAPAAAPAAEAPKAEAPAEAPKAE